MILTLRALDGHGGAGEQRVLDKGTLTLGRGAENDWVLADVERTLSKQHCRIDRSADGFVITDQSTNGVFVGDDLQPVGRGRSRILADGDVVTLGPVRLLVLIGPDQAQDADAPAPALTAAFPFTGVAQSPGSPLVPPSGEPWLEAIPGGEFGPDRHVRPQGWEIPIDPADYAASGVQASAHPLDTPPAAFSQASEHAPALDTVMRLPGAQSVLPTDWNDADPLADATLAPSPLDALLAARPGGGARPLDLDAPASAPDPVAPKPAPDALHIPDEELLAPRAAAPWPTGPATQPAAAAQATGAPDVAVPAAPGPAATGTDLLGAFLDGAGLPRAALAGLDELAAMQDLGRMVRAAVEGARDILATRAMVKSELRVDQTVVQAAGNNAMKFAPDVQRCLAAMVGAAAAGHSCRVRPPWRQRMDDIKLHELALIAALNSVFAAICPAAGPGGDRGQGARRRAGIGLHAADRARGHAAGPSTSKHYRALQDSGAENTGGSLLAPLAAAYARQAAGAPHDRGSQRRRASDDRRPSLHVRRQPASRSAVVRAAGRSPPGGTDPPVASRHGVRPEPGRRAASNPVQIRLYRLRATGRSPTPTTSSWPTRRPPPSAAT